MKIILAGGSGFLGSAITSLITASGGTPADPVDVVVLTRRATPPAARAHVRFVPWTPNGETGAWARELNGATAIINLAGESIAAKRWTAAQKTLIRDSRLLATRSLTAAIRELQSPPAVFVSGSAVGYYGDRGNETLTETSPPGRDFLAVVCEEWEAAAAQAASITRVALVRTGIVLDRNEGALPKMILPFRMFVGGPLGSGRQYVPWIHKDDWSRLVWWIVQHEGARGPINATSPQPVTNAEFSSALGQALKRPTFLPTPPFALRLALGEMADALLLGGQRALPVRASDLGFSFRFNNVDEALADVLK